MYSNTLLLAIAVLMLASGQYEFLRTEGKLTPARRTTLLVVLAFAAAAIVVQAIELLR